MPRQHRISKLTVLLTTGLSLLLCFLAGSPAIFSAPPRGSQGDPCAATDALSVSNARENHLKVLRAFRDETLGSNLKGKSLIALFQRHSPRVVALFARDSSLRNLGGQFLILLTPPLKSLVSGSGGRAIITKKLARSGATFFESLAKADKKRGGGELAQAISFELKELPPLSLVGMNMDQAWDHLSHTPIQTVPGGSPEPQTIPGLNMQAGDERTPCPATGSEVSRSGVEAVPFYKAITLAQLDRLCVDAFPGTKLFSVKTVRCAPDPRGRGFGPNVTADLRCAP